MARVPAPELAPSPAQNPCSEERVGFYRNEYRYDAQGRIVDHVERFFLGNDAVTEDTHVFEDSPDRVVETVTVDGGLRSRTVTTLRNGVPAEADQFKFANGAFQPSAHLVWTYDSAGRLQTLVTTGNDIPTIDRYFYDSAGRLYYSDHGNFADGDSVFGTRQWVLRSWYASGVLKSEAHASEYTGAGTETRWDPCGDVMYRANRTPSGRWSRWTDWSWDERGLPSTRHDIWTTELPGWESVETFVLDGSGRVKSSAIKTHAGEGFQPVPDQTATYSYDDAGHAIRQDIDGKTTVSIGYDDAGRLTALDVLGLWPQRWTYDGCRP